MWGNKNKAITFSFDDGVKQDIRAIEILNKYNLKGTFNLNSAYLGIIDTLDIKGKKVPFDKVIASDVKKIYFGHEVAVHTMVHPSLTYLDDSSIIYQVETDRQILSNLVDYEVVGMAYPCGANDERVTEVIRKNTKIKYARETESTYGFDLQKNLLRFRPSVYYIEDSLFDVCEKFLNIKSDKPQLLYIWGHTFEMDAGSISWDKFEELCKLISNKGDIFYGTNKEVLLEDNI